MNIQVTQPQTLIFTDVDLTTATSFPLILANPGKNVAVFANPFIKITSATGPGLGSVDINIGNNAGSFDNLATLSLNNTNLYLVNSILSLTKNLQTIDISTNDVIFKISPNFIIPYTTLKATIIFQYYYY